MPAEKVRDIGVYCLSYAPATQDFGELVDVIFGPGLSRLVDEWRRQAPPTICRLSDVPRHQLWAIAPPFQEIWAHSGPAAASLRLSSRSLDTQRPMSSMRISTNFSDPAHCIHQPRLKGAGLPETSLPLLPSLMSELRQHPSEKTTSRASANTEWGNGHVHSTHSDCCDWDNWMVCG